MTPEDYYHFFTIKGTVASSKSTSERVYSEQHSSATGRTHINSELHESTSVWITDLSDCEHNLNFDGNIPLRDGHQLNMLYMGKKNEKKGLPIAAYNATAKILVRHNTKKVRRMVPYADGSSFGCLGIALGLIAMLVSFSSFNTALMSNKSATLALIAALIWTISLAIAGHSKANKIQNQIEALLEKEISKAAGFEGSIPPDIKVQFTG